MGPVVCYFLLMHAESVGTSSSAPVSHPSYIPFFLSRSITELAWGLQSQAVESFFPLFFLPSMVKGKERKCCGSHSQWELILQCENIRIAQLDQSQGSPCTGSHVYLEGAEQKKFKNLSVRQAFSRQHNLILRQSAVYAMPKHMIMISLL